MKLSPLIKEISLETSEPEESSAYDPEKPDKKYGTFIDTGGATYEEIGKAIDMTKMGAKVLVDKAMMNFAKKLARIILEKSYNLKPTEENIQTMISHPAFLRYLSDQFLAIKDMEETEKMADQREIAGLSRF